MVNETEILKLLLPEFLVEHFDIVKYAEENKILHINFEEKSTIPQEFSSQILQSKGFLPEITVDDFPLRVKYLKLHIKRRRWTNKNWLCRTTSLGFRTNTAKRLESHRKRNSHDTRFCRVFKKNQPILKRFLAKQLVNFMALMVENFKDNTKIASAIIKTGNRNLTQKITYFFPKTFPQNFLWTRWHFLMVNYIRFSLPKKQKEEKAAL